MKVTKSYWPGLFRCSESIDIPRTNELGASVLGVIATMSGEPAVSKGASASLVVKGGSRIVAELATRQRPEEGLVLPKGYVETWQRERVELEKRREARRQQRRFRHDPHRYLQEKLEELLSAKIAILGFFGACTWSPDGAGNPVNSTWW